MRGEWRFAGTVAISVAAILVVSVVAEGVANFSRCFSALCGCAVLACRGWVVAGGWGSGSGRTWGVAVFWGGLKHESMTGSDLGGTCVWLQGLWAAWAQGQGKGKR